MEVSWTSPAWELLLPAVRAPRRQRRRLLESALRDAVRSGRIAPGTRLPASRALAADLGVSRGLVTSVYDQLRAEGYLDGRPGSGTYAGGGRTPPGTTAAATAPGVPPGGRRETPHPGAVARGGAPGGGEAAPGPATRFDFRPGQADPRLFPRAAWGRLYRQVLAGTPDAALRYGDPRGVPEVRTALAEVLIRRRGVVASPDRIVVCGGVAQAISLLTRVLAAAGHTTIAVEDPGAPEHAMLAGTNGLAPLPVPVGTAGPALDAAPTRAALVTPAHQFPTGVAYPPEVRSALASWASTVDGLLIEDDYDGDFRYDRAPVGALQGLAPDRVAYTGSVSKSLASGLRLGWLVVPDRWLSAVVERKRADDLCGPVLEQRTLAAFLTTGRYDAHLRRCQRIYRARRDSLVAAVREYLPAARITGIAAGLHAVLHLPGGDEAALAAAAHRAGIQLRGLRHHGSTGTPGFVFGYAHLTPDTITAGVAALAAAWRT
ncbi:GntR family transcriptional regulator [Actinocatenispora thailandica]|uniref:GntR family transcriptional regulator n=1 Tax=Actinocatenispora thailandica TaxID=227318 RepID=A0A7R7DR43_9ACTN|nr:PLP-dependent aminotransferase family protein [Actinocatenispora thailandica]BCJ36095.1 GntR family transcriptional regulator [Actinocatenispora thailandica]